MATTKLPKRLEMVSNEPQKITVSHLNAKDKIIQISIIKLGSTFKISFSIALETTSTIVPMARKSPLIECGLYKYQHFDKLKNSSQFLSFFSNALLMAPTTLPKAFKVILKVSKNLNICTLISKGTNIKILVTFKFAHNFF